MKKTKIFIPLGILTLIALFFAFHYTIANVLSYSPIRPARFKFEGITPSSMQMKGDEFDITVGDTIKMKGWFIHSKIMPARGTIFLLHGIAASKAMMLPMAKMLTEEGFNYVLYDSRANGESGGLNCTFGFYEKYDLSSYIDSTLSRYPGSGPYAVFGHSLGGAVAIQSLAHDKRLVCGIAQSPFSDLRQILRDYFARMIFVRVDFVPDEALKYSEKIAKFSADSVKPGLAALKITQPVMIIHGLKDTYISPKYGKKIFDNLSSKQKEWYPVLNAAHNDVSLAGKVEWQYRVTGFYKKYLKSE